MRDSKYDNLDLFLGAYKLTNEEQDIIRERVHKGGMSPDDPFAIQVALDTITEIRNNALQASLKALPTQVERSLDAMSAGISKKVSTDIDQRNGRFMDELRHRVGLDTENALRASIAKADFRVFQRAAIYVALACLLSAAVTGSFGYAIGRQDVRIFEHDFAQVAVQPDAQTWLEIIENNPDLDTTLLEYCYNNGPNNLPQSGGGEACNVPLWIDGGTAPKQGGIASYIAALPSWVPPKFSAWMIALFGFAVGVLVTMAITSLRWRNKED